MAALTRNAISVTVRDRAKQTKIQVYIASNYVWRLAPTPIKHQIKQLRISKELDLRLAVSAGNITGRIIKFCDASFRTFSDSLYNQANALNISMG